MRLFRRRRAVTEPKTTPIPVLPPATAWRQTYEIPDVGALIEFDWHGLFTGRFQGAQGLYWMVYMSYFGQPSRTRNIRPDHITWWRYK